MPTQAQLDLAKKYWYTQEQINQDLANPWSVKRSAVLNNPNIAQPIADVGQISTWVNAGGETLYNFGAQTPQAPTVPTVPTTPTVQQPVPWSASSIFWPENTFENQYYKNLNDQYNTPIDEEAIRRQKQADYQAQLDSVKAIYADQLNQARVRGQGRQGSSSAIQARRGLLGSNVGEAMTNNIETLNVQEQDLVRQEEANAIAAIQGLIRSWANEEIAAKKLAIKEGWEKLLAYYSGAGDRKAKKTTDAAKKLLALGKDPSAISDADLATAGIDKNDLLIAFNEQKGAQEAAASTAELDQAKKIAEIDKINADIEKGQLDAMKYYEVGNKIYARNEDGTSRFIGNAEFNPYSGAMQVTAGNSVYNPVTGQFTQAPGGSFSTNAPAGWFRTDRHNNPTAMTTDVARTLGLVEGVDYTKWDPFPNNPNLFTARLNGDPIQTTIKALDTAAQDPNKSAFRTQWGQPRWTYIDMTDQQWNSMTPEQKTATITKMYQNEGGTGALVWGGGWLSELAQSVQKGIITIAQIPAAQRAGIAQELARSGAETPKTQEIQRNIDLVDSLLNSTSLNKITGNIQGRLPWVALGGDAQLALNQFEQVKNLLSLDSREKLKGTGAVSDFESKMLAAAASSLGRNLSDADFKAELQKIRDIFDGKYKYLTNDADVKNVQNTPATWTNDAYALYLKSIWQ